MIFFRMKFIRFVPFFCGFFRFFPFVKTRFFNLESIPNFGKINALFYPAQIYNITTDVSCQAFDLFFSTNFLNFFA